MNAPRSTNDPNHPSHPDHPDHPDHESFRERLDEFVDRIEEAAIEAELATGEREESIEEARSHALVRAGRMTLGFVVVIVGIAALPLPGPGWLIIAGGLTILSKDVAWAERLLRYIRKRVPGIPEDGKIPPSSIATMLVVTSAFVAASLWWTFGRGSDEIQAGSYEVTSYQAAVASVPADDPGFTFIIDDDGPLKVSDGICFVDIAVDDGRSKTTFDLGPAAPNGCEPDDGLTAVVDDLAGTTVELGHSTDGLVAWFFADDQLDSLGNDSITVALSPAP